MNKNEREDEADGKENDKKNEDEATVWRKEDRISKEMS